LKPKFIDLYIDLAMRIAQMSYAERAKVGALVVSNDAIISYGYNGMPRSWPNQCEVNGITQPEVLHAESNAITKLARFGHGCSNMAMFCTHSPCLECAKLIYQSGIKSIYYKDTYRDTAGIEFLEACPDINVIKHETK
jgi:dCMP deaminase